MQRNYRAVLRKSIKDNRHSRCHKPVREYYIFFCPYCIKVPTNSRLCGYSVPGNVSNQRTYYSCGAKRNKSTTTKPHDEKVIVSHVSLDSKVWDGLIELLDDPEKLEAQLDKRLERNAALAYSCCPANDGNAKEFEKLAVQEGRLIGAYREGIISFAELKEQKAKLAVKRKVLEAKKNAAPDQQDDPGQQDRGCFGP